MANMHVKGTGNVGLDMGNTMMPKYVGARAEVTKQNNLVTIWLKDYKGETTETIAEAIESITTNADGSLTFTLPDGAEITTEPIKVEEIFVATYDETDYEDVLDAYNDGKVIFCKYFNDDVVAGAVLGEYVDDSFNFYYFYMGEGGRYTLDEDGWSKGALTYVIADTTVNGKKLETDITLDASDVGALSDVQIDGVSVASDGVASINTFVDATQSVAGAKGVVPAPPKGTGYDKRILCSDKTWIMPYLSVSRAVGTNNMMLSIKKNTNLGDSIASVSLNPATSQYAGVMTPDDKAKLDSLTITDGVIDVSNLPVYDGGTI